jgi:hypothetical protein
MLYVYCPRKSEGALELLRALNAQRLRKFDGIDFWDKKKRFQLKEGDQVICWGAVLPELEGIKVLNGVDKPVSKYKELERLSRSNVPVIGFYTTVPKNLINSKLILPRIDKHQSGRDLIVRPRFPDFYTLKEDFVNEYRIHSFNGKSIRAGIKVVRDGFTVAPKEEDWKLGTTLAHPWIRSFDAGWRVKYDEFKSNGKLRKLAHMAVKALDLTFGAVDIAEREDGVLRVLEVNRAPGIEGNSVLSYARAIKKWLEGKDDIGGVGAGPQEED